MKAVERVNQLLAAQHAASMPIKPVQADLIARGLKALKLSLRASLEQRKIEGDKKGIAQYEDELLITERLIDSYSSLGHHDLEAVVETVAARAKVRK